MIVSVQSYIHFLKDQSLSMWSETIFEPNGVKVWKSKAYIENKRIYKKTFTLVRNGKGVL